MSEGSALGEQAKAIMAEGGMVPTTLILDLLLAAMATPYSQEEEGGAATHSFLVDGFPRKLDQLQEFEAKVSCVWRYGDVRTPDLVSPPVGPSRRSCIFLSLLADVSSSLLSPTSDQALRRCACLHRARRRGGGAAGEARREQRQGR